MPDTYWKRQKHVSKKEKKTQNADVETQTQYPNGYLAYFLPAYFTIQLIFATIHEPHYTF